MSSALKAVKGMKDVLPGSKSGKLYRHVIDQSRSVLESQYKFEQALVNIIESESLYKKTLGVTSDIVLKEMYQVSASSSSESQSSSGAKDVLVLRPEGTAGLLRAVLQNAESMRSIRKQTVKAWYWGPMFRHERPQAGRLRQFYQLGMETVGGTRTEVVDLGHQLQTDFEAIESSWQCLSAIFGDHLDTLDLEVEINNLGGSNTLKDYSLALQSVLQPNMQDLSQASQQRLQAGHPLRILESKSPIDQAVLSNLDLPDIDDFIERDWRSNFDELQDLLKDQGVKTKRNKSLVRGLDYYNGTCFEVKLVIPEAQTQSANQLSSVLGKSQNTLLAGGRYDYLASYLQGKTKDNSKRERLPAIGWAAGIDRLVLILEALSKEDSVREQTDSQVSCSLGITSIIDDKTDSAETAREIRKATYTLKKAMLAQKDTRIQQVQVDLRDKLKLNDRLQGLLDQTRAVVVIGQAEAKAILTANNASESDQSILQVQLPVKQKGTQGHQVMKVEDLPSLYSD